MIYENINFTKWHLFNKYGNFILSITIFQNEQRNDYREKLLYDT